jgi:FtsZ-binding cell division protein ZapB
MKKYDELAEDEKVKIVKAELIRKQEKLEREREELRRRNDMIIKEMSAFQKRIVKAFPKMEHKQYKGVISRIREKIEKSNG